MFRYQHKEIGHERFTLTCFNMQLLGTLICSREEVAQPGWERHWPGCSPLYVIRTVCQALGQVAVDVQLRQPRDEVDLAHGTALQGRRTVH